MTNRDKPTEDEHFISQFYLNRFSSKKKIYQFDLLNLKKYDDPVPVKSICFEKNLYEFRNEDGTIIHTNLVENSLHNYETQFAKVFDSICKKAKIEDNYSTLCFLTKMEKAYLFLFMTIIVLRSPDVINAAQETAKEFANSDISDITARNIALQICLPIYKELKLEEAPIFKAILQLFVDKSFKVGVTEKGNLITGDNPVIIHGDYHKFPIDEVILPISPNIALYMKPLDRTESHMKNRLVELRGIDVDYFNASIVRSCRRWIYSKQPFTEKQITWIKKNKRIYDEFRSKEIKTE